MPQEKLRLDELLIKRGVASDIKFANSLILSGSVLVDDVVVSKAGLKFPLTVKVRLKEKIGRYVSRGANKLLPIIEKYNISLKDVTCIDLGASTGGFTQVLLEKEASKVYAIDVGYGLIAGKLRNNPKVEVIDRFHAKDISTKILKEIPEKLFFTMDLSFISLKNIFPSILRFHSECKSTKFEGLTLLKPQFEAKENELEKGIVIDPKVKYRIIKDMVKYLKKDFKILHLAYSPLKGAEGNEEFFIHWEK